MEKAALIKKIEGLERELAEVKESLRIELADNDHKLKIIDEQSDQLAAEKALADQLERELTDAKLTATAQYKGNLYPESWDGWEMCVNDMLGSIEGAIAAYRKARGL